MTTTSYAFRRGEPKRLEIDWDTSYTFLTIRLDGNIVKTISNARSALNSSQTIPLPNGSPLRVEWQGNEIYVSYKGSALPDSPGDPARKLNSTVVVLTIISVMTVVFGIIIASISQDQTTDPYYSKILIGAGILFGILTIGVSRRSRVALQIAVYLYGADILGIVLNLFRNVSENHAEIILPFYAGALVAHLFMLTFMFRGLKVFDELQMTELAKGSTFGPPPFSGKTQVEEG